MLQTLFFGQGVAQAVVALSLSIFFGLLIGKVRIAGVSLGVGGVLFSGLALGHFGMASEPHILLFAREFGLILFVYAIGMSVGPTFLESFKKTGLKLNLLAVLIVSSGVIITIICFNVFKIPMAAAVGLFSGGVTNTPSLSAASQMFGEVLKDPSLAAQSVTQAGMSYAVAYPFGIFGIILTMLIIRAYFKINLTDEANQYLAETSIKQNISQEAMEHLKDIPVSNKAVIRKTLAELELLQEHGITDLQILRNGTAIAIDANTRIHWADVVSINAKPEKLEQVKKLLGNNAAAITHPQIAALFIGMFIGVFVGSIPVFIPGLPAPVKLGLAGGPLLISIFLARRHHCLGLTFYMNNSANLIVREIGISLFLACVGLNAGGKFLDTLINGPGLYWMAVASLITIIPLLIAAFIGFSVLKVRYGTLCGVLSGSMTDPPALAFATQMLGTNAAASGYAAVYPLTMIMRIFAGQLLVLIFSMS